MQKINKSLLYYQLLVNQGQSKMDKDEKVVDDIKASRSYDIKFIQKNNKKQLENMIKTRLDVKRKQERKKPDEPVKNKRIISNNNVDSLKAGFLDSKDKKSYIKNNQENFKSLSSEDQRSLFKIFLDFL